MTYDAFTSAPAQDSAHGAAPANTATGANSWLGTSGGSNGTANIDGYGGQRGSGGRSGMPGGGNGAAAGAMPAGASPGAAGNLATETLVAHFARQGIATHVDPGRLEATAAWIRSGTGRSRASDRLS